MKRLKKWYWRRRTVQILALVLFFYLLLGTSQGNTMFLPQDLFFRLDPLAGLAAMSASRSFIVPMLLGMAVLLLAVATGRSWCGWLCPLGTALDWTPSRRQRDSDVPKASQLRRVKEVFFLIILIAAAFGSLTLIILDPITLLVRSASSVVLPVLSLFVTSAETWLYQFSFIQPVVGWFDGLVRNTLITDNSFYLPNLTVAAIFIGVLALNAIRSRFWCRYLCPLGGLLGLLSKMTRLKHQVDHGACISCRRCARICPTGAIEAEKQFHANPTECITCLDCVDVCPKNAVSFRWKSGLPELQRYEPSRRQLLASLGTAVIVAPLLHFTAGVDRKESLLVRPPGSSEKLLTSRCIRCGLCLKVCPTGGLQPSQSATVWENLWTPALVSRVGHCDYSCNACGQICPTGAIPDLTLAEKRRTVMGLAIIDEKRCIPFAEGRDCIVCEEMCPVPGKAIVLEKKTFVNSEGKKTSVLLPRVRPHSCIGCGICEHYCPVRGESAIRVFPSAHSLNGGGGQRRRGQST